MTTDHLRPDEVPRSIKDLVDRWQAAGGVRQGRFPWPRDAWIEAFPEIAQVSRDLSDQIGRDDVRPRCRDADTDPASARRAFILAMAWGYGTSGYGRYRTARVLGDPEAGHKLHSVAQTLLGHGAAAAYERMATDCRLAFLGPAFGTKFLYFCDAGHRPPAALILDRLVADWWKHHLEEDLSAWTWNSDTYRTYITLMTAWAERVGCLPDDIETLIFREEARRLQLPWALNEAS